jgi:putative serine protease PepD
VGDNDPVSPDDDERPEPAPGEPHPGSAADGPDDAEDTRPIATGPWAPPSPFPPPPGGPDQPEWPTQPPPSERPFGSGPTASYPPPLGPTYAGPVPGPVPGPAPSGPAPAPGPAWGDASPGGATSTTPRRTRAHVPASVFVVTTAIALAIGLVGGVIGGAVVSSSINDGSGSGSVSVISADNGSAAPLKADNGSVAAVAERVLPSTVQVLANGGADGSSQGGATGSGFVLDDRGHVITNNHVVADATGAGNLEVVDQDGTKHAATILGRSPVYDLAVLHVSHPASLRPAAIGLAKRLRVGDTVVAIGSPLGLSSTVTSGIVSATDRPVTTGDAKSSSYINALQTDAAINPGNSGGPLANLRGQVVGVNSAIATAGGTIGGQSGNIGVGFAIPMEQVRITAAQILATGKARYPVIGADVSTRLRTSGAEVTRVHGGTPAAAGGLRKGDVVTGVDGKRVTDGVGLIVAIRSHQPGETVDLSVRRNGHGRDIMVTLDSEIG